MPLDPIQTTHLVLQVIDTWLRGFSGGGVKAGKTISGAGRQGYSMNVQRYRKFCEDIANTLSANTGRALVLTPTWQAANYGDEIEVFAGEVTKLLLVARLKKRGEALAALAETIDLT